MDEANVNESDFISVVESVNESHVTVVDSAANSGQGIVGDGNTNREGSHRLEDAVVETEGK